jgi:hypothetical protein
MSDHLITGDGFFIEKNDGHYVTTIYIDKNADHHERHAMATYLNERLTAKGRSNYERAAKRGINLNAVVSAHKVTMGVNHNLGHKRKPKASDPKAAISLALFKESITAGGEKYAKAAEDAANKMHKLNAKTADIAKLAKRSNWKYAVKKVAGKEYAEAQEAVNKAVKLGMIGKDSKLESAMKVQKNFRADLKSGVMVSTMAEAKTLARVANSGKYLRGSFFALGIIMGGVQIAETYKDGGNVGASAAGVVGGIAGGIAGGIVADGVVTLGLAVLSFTPVGWVVLIGSAVAVAAGSVALGSVGSSSGKDFYLWADLHLRKWL